MKKIFLPNFDKKLIKRGDFLATGMYIKKIIKNFRYFNENSKNNGLENLS